MKKQSQQIQTRDVEGPFDHIRTCICSPLKITFSVGTSQYKVAICPLVSIEPVASDDGWTTESCYTISSGELKCEGKLQEVCNNLLWSFYYLHPSILGRNWSNFILWLTNHPINEASLSKLFVENLYSKIPNRTTGIIEQYYVLCVNLSVSVEDLNSKIGQFKIRLPQSVKIYVWSRI